MKKIIITLLATFFFITCISFSYAAGPGPYLGVNIGMANLRNEDRPVPAPSGPLVTPKNNSIAGRLFAGGSANNFIGGEIGLTRWGSSSYEAPNGESGSIHTSSFDVQAVGTYPFGPSGFSVFGKLGFAYLASSYSRKLIAPGDRSFNSGFYPIFGFGASYDVTQRWVVDLSYSAIRSPSRNLRGPAMFALGISYHFTDVYCGQFLC